MGTNNPIENALVSAISGAGNIWSSIVNRDNQKEYQKKAGELYTNAIDMLNEQAQSIMNPTLIQSQIDEAKRNSDNPNQFIDAVGTDTGTQRTRLARLFNNTGKVNAQLRMNPYGAAYIPEIENAMKYVYGAWQDMQPQPEIKEGRDGEFYYFDKKNPTNFKKLTDFVPKKKEYTAEDLSKMTYEQAKQLSPENLYNYLFNLPEDVRNKLAAENPDLQDRIDYMNGTGIYADTGNKGRRGSGFSLPKFDISNADNSNQSKMKKLAELKSKSVAMGWENFAYGKDPFGRLDKNKLTADATEYDTLYKELQAAYPGVDIDKLVNDVNKGTFQRKGKKYAVQDFINDEAEKGQTKTMLNAWKDNIAKMWGRYTLDTNNADNNALLWVNELSKHKIFDQIGTDNQWEELKSWFKATTGRDLTNYVKR